jgi:uncharacterized damage-inducible protein DinB
MYTTISDFIFEWNKESMLTQKVLDSLTNDSLEQQVYPEGRTLGRIIWHITTNIPEYLAEFGFVIDRIEDGEGVPALQKKLQKSLRM